ncbi:unnamed protein product [Rotaria sp. Silwood1]|nr:unnamed protein product [Rotaria sp. Silwood1]CAF1633266.1 unnamed protein product [Rotaria sp. Silwood1]CAF3767012.1 unnamed protein product [Rotaria sp. Silwood1]CAF3777739.1 unnamed protein product [Rotaria sp. Silwood1]CAF3819482.1 unnamed protein product [Rotaria sp. Silwood1]
MKRSYSYLNLSSTKRTKIITSDSLKFFIEKTNNSFINYLHMPPIIFKHQLYSFISNNRTLIDCELQDMFNNNKIRLFHSDFGIMLMFTNDYHLLIERQLNDNNLSSLSIEKNRLKQRFIQDLLPNNICLSIDKYTLENKFQLNLNDIHLLIQLGLLLPKQCDQYWFSIPNLAPFITCLEKSRRTLLQMLSRRTYKEIPMNEFQLRDMKKKCLLGFVYHIHDLIGANLAHIIDTPTGSIVKIGPEKV